MIISYKKIKWLILFYLFSFRYKKELVLYHKESSNNVGILISPWYETSIPFYSFLLCIIINKFTDKNIIIIHDDLLFSTDEYNPKYQYKWINNLLSSIPASNLVKLSSLKDSEYTEEFEEVRLTYANLVHDTRSEINIDSNLASIYKIQVISHLKKIKTLFCAYDFNYIVVPGGISLSAGIIHSESKKYNRRVVTFDSGVNILQFCSNGVASHFTDLPRALDQVYRIYDSTVTKILENSGRLLLKDRIAGKDRFGYQKNNKMTDITTNYILLVLNVPWDSAALLQLKYFKNQYEWIIETIKFIISNTNKNIIIREHPADSGDNKSNIEYKKLLNEVFGKNQRIIFISAYDEVNTYGLINNAELVVVNTSSVGLECALLGKHVISVSQPYYTVSKFVLSPNNSSHYFACLLNRANCNLKYDINQAFTLYYLAQKISFGSALIYPGNNFISWLFKKKTLIFTDPSNLNIINVLDKNIPYSLLSIQDIKKRVLGS